ncbi:MAG: hypothetical protein ACN6RK_17735 [Stenotrophomonas sp.]
MKRLLLVILLGPISAGAEAREPMVYVCLEGERHVYQSTPCAGVKLRHWAMRPEGIDEAPMVPNASLRSQLRQKDRSQKPRASSVRQRNKGGTKIDACGQARSGRERAYAKAELKSDFAMSSFWDNKVHEACW